MDLGSAEDGCAEHDTLQKARASALHVPVWLLRLDVAVTDLERAPHRIRGLGEVWVLTHAEAQHSVLVAILEPPGARVGASAV